MKDPIYLVFLSNLAQAAFSDFDKAVDYVRKKYRGTPHLQHIVISSVPFNPPAREDEDGG